MAKKYCTKCGAEIPDGAKFCPKCGTPVLPDDDNLMDPTQSVETQDTTNIPHFDNAEDTQKINPSDYSDYNEPQQDYYSQHQDTSPYNNPDYTNSYQYESPKSHVGIIVLIVIIAAFVGGFFFLFFAKPEVLTNLLPGHHNETAAETESSVEETKKPEKKEKATAKSDDTDNSDDEALPEDTAKPKETPTPKPTSGVLNTTDDDTEPVSTTQKGTVFISANVSGPRRIKVRTGPSQSAADTKARKYNGDSVTVYETKQAEGYTWYRIGDNQWIAGNGSSFGVNIN